jgi:hypothetical protein
MDTQENPVSQEQLTPEKETEPYRERPRYQVWAARIGLVIMIICVILYYYHIASGGMQ